MTRLPRSVVAAAVLLVLVAGLSGGVATGAAADAGGSGRVVLVSLPRVTWDDLGRGDTPVLDELLDRAAVASLSVRTVGPVTDPGGAYLSLGAGNRADSSSPSTDGLVAPPGEVTDAGPAAAVYERRTGRRPVAALLGLTFPEQQARNRALLYGAVPGALGSALRSAGGMAAVGNADQPGNDGPLVGPINRQVGLAALDRTGRAPAGRVDGGLLRPAPTSPFGVRLDPDAVVAAYGSARADAPVVLVELSDLERAEQARAQSTPAAGRAQFRDALRSSDRLVGRLLADVDPARDTVVVLGPTAPLAREQLTVFGVVGPGWEAGFARSASTRRDGFVSLTDVASTVLRELGVPTPDGMNDTPVSQGSTGGDAGDRRAAMVRDSERAGLRDDATGPVTVAFIILLVVVLSLVAWSLARAPGWSRGLRVACLLVMSVPPAAFLSGLLPYGGLSVPGLGFAILGIAAAVAAVSVLVGRRAGALAGAMTPPVVAVVVLAADVLTGGRLQINTVFGYSPVVAGRFAGFGNQAFAIFSISSLIVVTAGWELWARARPGSSDRGRLTALAGAAVVVVVIDGAPQLGSDVGGVLALVPAFAVAALVLTGRRIRWRTAVVVGAATIAVLAVFASIDLSRPAASRSHLGRFAQQVLDGGALMILQRKLGANLSVLTSTLWTVVIPVALLFLAYLHWRPSPGLRLVQERHPGFRAFGLSGLVLGVLAWGLNDSGVAIPAMMLTVALPYTGYLVLESFGDTGPAPPDASAGGATNGAEVDPADGSAGASADGPAERAAR